MIGAIISTLENDHISQIKFPFAPTPSTSNMLCFYAKSSPYADVVERKPLPGREKSKEMSSRAR
jgi:hypothetical protein